MFNRAILVGRMTAEPELRQTPNGVAVCTFTLAVDRRMSKDKKADFINCVIWRQGAEFVTRYFHKGDPIGIEGSIQTRNYEDKQGNKRTAVEVVADNAFFVGSKGQGGSHENAQQVAQSGGNNFQEVEVENTDDWPF